jgi:L-alanine-DL-glutamate epimerase-like enolase superfamily enzyme
MQSILKNIIAIEQPVAKEDYEGLAEIKKSLKNIDIYADESVVTLHDLEKIIEANAVSGVNIKIQKAGGIWHASQMAKRAHEAGLKIMTGCMMETPIGTAAGLHFAVSTPNISFTDIDSDLFLFQEFEKPLFTSSPFESGIRLPFEKPGLGIEMHVEIADELVRGNKIAYEEII